MNKYKHYSPRLLGLALLAVSLTLSLPPLLMAADTPSAPTLVEAGWIWSSRQALENSTDTCLFRRKLRLESKPTEATIAITADNSFDLYINGQHVSSDGGMDGAIWKSVENYRIDSFLLDGANVIAVAAENLGGPGGLLAAVRIRYDRGEDTTLVTDEGWLVASRPAPGWTEADHDDTLWKPAIVLGRHGMAPWGDLSVPGALTPRQRSLVADDRFTDPPADYAWPAGAVFLTGKAPLSSTPGAPQATWPVLGSAAFFEHDTPAPAVLGHQLLALIPARPDVEPRVLVDADSGLIGSPASSWNGEEVFFSFAPEGEKFFSLFRVRADGEGFQRLTAGPFHDYDPAVLPGGDIVFASTRIGCRDEYHGNPSRSLFVLDPANGAIRPLTHHISYRKSRRGHRPGIARGSRSDTQKCSNRS